MSVVKNQPKEPFPVLLLCVSSLNISHSHILTGTEDDVIDISPTVADNDHNRSSSDVEQQDSSPSPHTTATAEDTRYAATRKRRLLLMDDDSSDNEEETNE